MLVNWNSISPSKNFAQDFTNSYEIKKEIQKLKEPVKHLENFITSYYIIYAGFITGQLVLFMLRKTNPFIFFSSLVFITIILGFIYMRKEHKNAKEKSSEIEQKQNLIDSFESQIAQDLYDLSSFELVDAEYQKYCMDNGLEKQYKNFKIALINQNLQTPQVLSFYEFMKHYCEENINTTALSDIQVKAVNKQDNFQFFQKG